MQGHLVLGGVVDALDDVDLAAIGPVGAKDPASVTVNICKVFYALGAMGLTKRARYHSQWAYGLDRG